MKIHEAAPVARSVGIGVAVLALALALGQVLGVVTVVSMGTSPSDAARGPELTGFLAAGRAPGGFLAYKATMALVWGLMGSLLFSLAAHFRGQQPVKAGILAVLGVLQAFGVLGELFGLVGVAKLSSIYLSAEPSLRRVVELDFLTLNYLSDSAFFLAQSALGLAFPLIAAAGRISRSLPTWLSSLFALAAIPALALAFSTLNQSYLVPVILANILLTSALFVILSITFFRTAGGRLPAAS